MCTVRSPVVRLAVEIGPTRCDAVDRAGRIKDVTVQYHTTDQAEAILRDGFHDGTGSYMFAGLTLTGVFVSRWPVDVNEGAKGEQVLEVALPDDLDLEPWEIAEEDRQVWEWCVPGRASERARHVSTAQR
jgi:hypothetical protein